MFVLAIIKMKHNNKKANEKKKLCKVNIIKKPLRPKSFLR